MIGVVDIATVASIILVLCTRRGENPRSKSQCIKPKLDVAYHVFCENVRVNLSLVIVVVYEALDSFDEFFGTFRERVHLSGRNIL